MKLLGSDLWGGEVYVQGKDIEKSRFVFKNSSLSFDVVNNGTHISPVFILVK